MPQKQTEKTTSEPSDEEPKEILDLVARCARKDVSALREFFRIYSQDIYNFPIKVFHLDEDQASDFYLYAFEKLKTGQRFASFQGRSRFRTWFYTVLRNLVIDWMRTLRELETVTLKSPRNFEGGDLSFIENVADPRSLTDMLDNESEELLSEALHQLPIELRVMLKLSYVFYFHFDSEEIAYLAQASRKTEEEILKTLARIKNDLTSKSLKNMQSIDKITSLFLNIRELKARRDALKQELMHMHKKGTQWNGPDPVELEKIEQLIQKKEKQRDKLIEKKERGNFIVRTPHKEIARLLGISEGSVSVQLNRITERIRKTRQYTQR